MKIIKKRIGLTLSPSMTLAILSITILIFSGVSVALINFTFFETKHVLTQVNKTSTNTNEILDSSTAVNKILTEVQTLQTTVEEEREDRTRELLPVFIRQFNQTDRIDMLVQNMSDLLAQSTVTQKSILTQQQELTEGIEVLTNATTDLIRYQETIASIINRTASIN